MKIGIVGAGIMGQVLALRLLQLGYQVTLFDQCFKGAFSASRVAAGMLSLYAELEHADQAIYQLGRRSLELWPGILSCLVAPVSLTVRGSLLLAHRQDKAELQRVANLIQHKIIGDSFRAVQQDEITQLEPELTAFSDGYYLAEEAFIDVNQLFSAVASTLSQLKAQLIPALVKKILPYKIVTDQTTYTFAQVFDCRGMGAKTDIKHLRGVRGEIICLHAPEVNITRPIRLVHPRYRLYIVPKSERHYLMGATEIECESMASIRVRSLLELLTAAYSVHPGFATATLVATKVGVRPTMSNHLPYIEYNTGLTRLNGLYRHGFLVAPALVETIIHNLHYADEVAAGVQK